uniref:Shisa like 2A n=1 Tax=Sinocyclocheilus rhinocerous TaxID=307959 RepID=A0A673GGA7_9TELE
MSSICTSYSSGERGFVKSFSCPTADSNARAVFCCGFNDMKYCCDDPNSFFPYEYGYMWWLSFGALLGLSIAAVVLLVFVITVCVLCYLFIVTKPSRRDNGLNLSVPGQNIHIYRSTEGKQTQEVLEIPSFRHCSNKERILLFYFFLR